MSLKPGLIARIIALGAERQELLKGIQGGEVGGQAVPYYAPDLAAVITILRGWGLQTGLSVEGVSQAGSAFLGEELGLQMGLAAGKDEKAFRRSLREMKAPADFIAIDARELPLSAEEIWRYMEGGKEEKAPAFGDGPPRNYGIRKFIPGKTFVLVNLVGEDNRQLYYRLRARHGHAFQSTFTGLVRV